ncbi:F0F1 ATP synthase subunit epsilon [uncultured Paraglaciecola sp.]|uniref:F0F1 ATP synthase subunit epsilon n=1 Tax=uncultured Paraglaciecola sp. TaxID=1765024 RepID=UPI0030D84E9B|tara:strand:- start:142656 stop:143051 length:396 start_codon:yes stop_codon:yes gene_type:complete
MNLNILLPNKVFAKHKKVLRVIVETLEGSYGVLPNRLDCTAALTPGILTYEIESGKELYIAIDQGVFVKKGHDILVSTRQAVQGIGLDELRNTIKTEFLALDEKQQEIRFAMDKLESSFLQGLTELSTAAR